MHFVHCIMIDYVWWRTSEFITAAIPLCLVRPKLDILSLYFAVLHALAWMIELHTFHKRLYLYRRNFIEVVQECIRDLFMNYRFISSLYIVYQTFGGSCLNILLLWRYSKSSNGAIISLCRSSMQLLQAWITGSARVLELFASTVTPELDS